MIAAMERDGFFDLGLRGKHLRVPAAPAVTVYIVLLSISMVIATGTFVELFTPFPTWVGLALGLVVAAVHARTLIPDLTERAE